MILGYILYAISMTVFSLCSFAGWWVSYDELKREREYSNRAFDAGVRAGKQGWE